MSIDWKNIGTEAKTILQTVAPTLGLALGGPLGGVAGTILSKALGTATGDSKAVETALLSADPAIMLKVRQGELDFKAHMADLGVHEDELQVQDVSNARQREEVVKDSTPRNLAYGILTATVVAIGCTLAGITHVDTALAGTMVGYLVSECKAVLGYYFGSSVGSKAKDEALAKAVDAS